MTEEEMDTSTNIEWDNDSTSTGDTALTRNIASREWVRGYNKALKDIVRKIIENNKVKVDSEEWLEGYKEAQLHTVEEILELAK